MIPSELYVPVNLAAAGAAVAAAHALGASWRDLGLARDRIKAGLRLGGITLIPIAAAVALGLAIPWTRDFFRDTTITGASTAEAVYTLLLRIPFGTAMSEELIFRGALLGLYLQRHRPWVAVVMSSAVFGLWHVLPTHQLPRHEPRSLGDRRQPPGAGRRRRLRRRRHRRRRRVLQLAAPALRQHPRAVAHPHRLQLDRLPRQPSRRA